MPTSILRIPLVSILISCSCLVMLTGKTSAVPFATQEVQCGTETCGRMVIDTYETLPEATSVRGTGGVHIAGHFEPARAPIYHYVQATTNVDTDSFRWFNDTSVPLPVPHLDPPPGGYQFENGIGTGNYTSSQPFDYLPWYDPAGAAFPQFLDVPRLLLRRAKIQADKTATDYFETWLVSVIEDTHNNNQQVKDDRYRIAPLLGWTWGFDIVYADVAPLGVDTLADFTVEKRDFAFVMAPSAAWTNVLSTKYGAGAIQDFWNITTGECQDCVSQVAEPSTILLLLPGVAGVMWLGHRKGVRFMPRIYGPTLMCKDNVV